MPEADVFEAPQGRTFYGALLEAITEAFVGNGIQNDGDGEVTKDDSTAMGVSVAASTGLRYGGSSYDVGSDSFTLSTGPTTTTNGEDDRRVDAVVFDSSINGGDGGYDVVEGTPEPNPEPPNTPADGLLLALVLVDHGVEDVFDKDILNWRAHAAVDYEVVTDEVQDDAITASKIADAVDIEEMRGRDGSIDGPVTTGTNAGAFGPVIDAVVDDSPSAGDEQSYEFAIDGTTFVKVEAEADGSGGLQNPTVVLPEGTTLPAGDIGTADLSEGSVTSAKIKANTIVEGDVAEDVSLETWRSRDGTVEGPIDVGLNPGSFGVVFDALVDDTPTAGTDVSYDFGVGGEGVLRIYGEADGSGGIQNARGQFLTPARLNTVTEEPDDAAVGNAIYDTERGTPLYGNGSVYDRPLSRPNPTEFSIDESGTVTAGNSGVVWIGGVEPGEVLTVYQAMLLLADGQPAPTGLDLAIARLDNVGGAVLIDTILEGDGSSVKVREQGDPLFEYTNENTSTETIAFVIDNGNFNDGSGSEQSVVAGSRGEMI